MQHLIQFTAFTPDDGEVTGVATVSAVTDGEGRSVIPWSQLAAIPGFREGDVIDHRDGERRPHLLGPGTDAPGHPAWCINHEDTPGDGRSFCWGGTTEIGDARLQLNQLTGDAATVWLLLEGPCEGEYLSPAEARERAQELRQIADGLDAHAQQVEAGSAVSS